jgi:hypothetical protein
MKQAGGVDDNAENKGVFKTPPNKSWAASTREKEQCSFEMKE